MSTPISRRTLLGATAAAIAAPAIVSREALGQTPISLTLGHGAAPGNPRTVAAAKFTELVKDKSAGKITVKVAGSEQLGNDVAMLTSLRTGALDLTANSQGPAAGIVPEIAALGLPFLFADGPAAFKVMDGPAGAELNQKFDAVGMVVLGWWDNGIRHITNSKRPIAKPADLQGLKIRTPADPATIDIFQALGAATQQIAFSELYVALQQGVVDGQENPLANIASSKLFEVNKFISLSAHKWESTPFLASKIAWGRLGEPEKKVMTDAAKEATALQRQLMQEAATKLLADFKANSAVAVNEVDRPAFQEATASVITKWREKPFGEYVKKVADAAKV
jgi:tripartite ATP-independent transporter DctP family solute receptor